MVWLGGPSPQLAGILESMDLDDALSLDEAARLLNRSPVTLRWAARTGVLRARRIGRDWVTTRDAVAVYAAWHQRRYRSPRDVATKV